MAQIDTRKRLKWRQSYVRVLLNVLLNIGICVWIGIVTISYLLQYSDEAQLLISRLVALWSH